MSIQTSPELYWVVLSAVLTSLLWVPHIVQRIAEMGPYEAFRDPHHDVPTRAAWAQRAIRAHTNAVENFAVFAVLAVAVHILGLSSPLTAAVSAAYFFARVGHYVFYVFATPWMPTPMFLVAFVCQLVLALRLFGAV